jgi:hypothetical protein
MRRAVLAGLAVAITLAGPTTGPLVGQKSLVLESFHSEIAVEPTGDLLVTETLRPRFTGSWNGVQRVLSTRHTTASGEAGRLTVELLSASDGAGRALRHERERAGGEDIRFKVWVPDARDRTAEVVIRYRVRGAVRFFAGDSVGPGEDFDELYWEVTGTDWEVPIERASAAVTLPPGATLLRGAAYYGPVGSSARAGLQSATGGAADTGGETVAVEPVGPLRSGEGLTLAVAWPAGTIPVPPGVARSVPVTFGPGGSAPGPGPFRLGSVGILPFLPLLIPGLVLLVAYRQWDRRGRDPARLAVQVRWDPPPDLSPAEAGTLIDHDPGMHDIVSILVDLAVRGYIVIEEREGRGFLKLGKDYAFHLVRPRREWDGLAAHERLFLSGLFQGAVARTALANLAEEGTLVDDLLEMVAGTPAGEGAPEGAYESVLLSDLRNEFYKRLPPIRDSVLDALVRKGLYVHRPDKVRTRWMLAAGAAMLLGSFGLGIGAQGSAAAAVTGIVVAAAGVLSAVILGVFAFLMPARTVTGARTLEAALGFRRFLERVETPRYRRMIKSPAQFEEYLPFAMAFRCEETWARAFDGLLAEPPDWYHGGRGRFVPSDFAGDLGTLASTARSTMASSPSSSGSGGGGSVGGGSGGGGGGGF